MSGPKAGTWCLVPAGEGLSFKEAQIICREYRECIERLHRQYLALLKRQPQYCIDPAVDSLTGTEPACDERQIAEMNNRYEIYIRLRDEVERTRAEHAEQEKQRILAVRAAEEQRLRLAAIVDTAESRALARQGPAPLAKTEVVGARQKFHDSVQRLLASLDPQTPPELRQQLQTLADQCLAAVTTVQADLLFTDLRVRVRHARQFQTRQQPSVVTGQIHQEAAEALAWLKRFAASRRPPSEPLRRQLIQVITGEVPCTNALRAEVVAALNEAECSYAGAMLQETLEELGYEVQEGFTTLFAQQGENFFQRPSWGKYHCRLTVDPHRHSLNFDMVRYGEAGAAISRDAALRDKEMEEAWCAELPDLLKQLAGHGVKISFTRKLAPGTIALQIIDDPRLQRSERSWKTALDQKVAQQV